MALGGIGHAWHGESVLTDERGEPKQEGTGIKTVKRIEGNIGAVKCSLL